MGHLYRAESDLVIIMVHGFCGDISAGGRFEKIAPHLNRFGYNVLAFNFSGCGESDDAIISLGKMIDDLHSTIRFVRTLGFRRVAFYGHSFQEHIEEAIALMSDWLTVHFRPIAPLGYDSI